eukprot:scaffold398_cov206-Pinguiococcus_pyrenoidosus.AAC.5
MKRKRSRPIKKASSLVVGIVVRLRPECPATPVSSLFLLGRPRRARSSESKRGSLPGESSFPLSSLPPAVLGEAASAR